MGNDPILSLSQSNVQTTTLITPLERVVRIELTTKPWQGFVLPLAPYPHL